MRRRARRGPEFHVGTGVRSVLIFRYGSRPRGAEVAAERQVGGAASAGVHGGAEGVEGRSDTVTGRRNTPCITAYLCTMLYHVVPLR